MGQLLEIIFLGIVQGLTEFLPVSSSGHLVVGSEVLAAAGCPPLEDVVEVNIVLHLGTLLAVIVFYWHRVWRLLGEDRRVAFQLLLGTIPAVVVGLPLKRLAPAILESPLLAGLMLPVTGLILIWASKRAPGDRDYRELGYGDVLTIGAAQAFAILPGISRSGSTIAAGLGVGMRRDSAATFAFLLAIPAIAGAGALELAELMAEGASVQHVAAGALLVGAATSFGVGLLALRWLIRWIEKGRLADFAWWCIPLGVVVTAWQLATWPVILDGVR